MSAEGNGGIVFSHKVNKTAINLSDIVKVQFKAHIADYKSHLGWWIWKIYYCADTQNRYLLSSGYTKPRKSLSLKAVLSFKKILPMSTFYFECILIENGKPIASTVTEECQITSYNLRSHFKVTSIRNFSPFYVPNNPIVLWIEYSSDPLPSKAELKVKAKLFNGNTSVYEKELPLVIGKKNLHTITRYPIQLRTNCQIDEKKPVYYLVEISESSKSNLLYTQKIPLKPLLKLSGISVSHVGFKRDIRLGEEAYLLGEIENHLLRKIRGKIYFYFFAPNIDFLLEVSRRFTIDPDNKEVISEDAHIPAQFGGDTYWVVGKYELKSRGVTLLGEILSDPRIAMIPNQPWFNVKIIPNTPDRLAIFQETIPLTINIRIDAPDPIKNAVCEIMERLEGNSERIIGQFRIKDNYYHSVVRWKVPSICATATFNARIKIKGGYVSSNNLKEQLEKVEIIPKKLHEAWMNYVDTENVKKAPAKPISKSTPLPKPSTKTITQASTTQNKKFVEIKANTKPSPKSVRINSASASVKKTSSNTETRSRRI